MQNTPFDHLAEVYDALVDWPRRLDREKPFYMQWFDAVDTDSVVDVACGTGRHAAMFHGWGLTVEGADVDPAMTAQARSMFGQSQGLRFVERSFTEPIRPQEPFDAAICVGNSLALAPDFESVARVVREMLAALRSCGVAVLQVLNLWRLPDGPCNWQKCCRMGAPPQEVLVAKGVHRAGTKGFVDLVVAPLDAPHQVRSESVAFLGLEAAQLECMATEAGAADVLFFGGYQDEPYDRQRSPDLIVVALKR